MKLWRALAFSLAFCLLLTGCQGRNRSTLKEEFVDNGRNLPYSQNIPLHEMDFFEYLLHLRSGPSVTLPFETGTAVELPCDVEYYRRKDDAAPALTLKRGTIVYIAPKGFGRALTLQYGLTCWPDYEEGWRYGYPFVTEPFDSLETVTETGSMYYVKTDSLFQVIDTWFGMNQMNTEPFPNSRKKTYIGYIDKRLYTHGSFCSPDLEKYYTTFESLGEFA